MPKDGGIVIYWPEESNFIYDAKPDFSYANSEWLVPLPYQNKNKIMSYWTTLSLDPIPNIWMLSAVSPVYVNGDWIGSTGHDIPLVNVLSETSLLEQQKGSTFVLITSKQELLASDIFAGKLKDSNGHVLLSDLSERQWEESFVNASKVEIIKNKHAQSIIDDNLFTVSYIEEQDWFLITSIPLLPIQQTLKNSFNHLSNITIGSIILEMVNQNIQTAIRNRKLFEVIYRIKHKNGSLKWVLERGQGIFDDSKVTMLEGVITDISELKQTQEELQTLNSRLDHKVKQRTADLEFTNSELQSQKFELAWSLTELKATQEQLLEEKKYHR